MKNRTGILALLAAVAVVATLPQAAAADGERDEKGLVRESTPFAGIPAEIRAKMAAQKPLVKTAQALQDVVEANSSTGFTSISLADNGVDLYWKGKLPAAVQSMISKRHDAPIHVRKARYSRHQLKRAEKQAMAYIGRSKESVYGVRVPADGSGLVLQSRRAGTDLRGFHRKALSGITMDLDVEVGVAPVLSSRNDDFAPFWGGASMINPGGGSRCSTGFGVVRSGVQFILTAGHCGYPGGTFLNGNGTRTLGTGAEENVGHDILLVRASAGSRIFDGGGLKVFENRTQFTKAVSGWGDTFPNEWICQSGMMSGAVCGLQNSNNLAFSYYNSSNGETYSDLVVATAANGVAVRGGDSGGPVFTLNGDRVVAKGVISGQNFYPMRISYNGKCLDADANNLHRNGTRLQLWTCNGSAQQQFYFRGDGSIRTATDPGYCVDADLGTINRNGTTMQLWQCNGQAQQRWNYNGFGAGDIRSAVSGRCIDADLGTINREGTKIQLWDCNGQAQQRWNTNSSKVFYQDFRTVNRDFGVTVLTS